MKLFWIKNKKKEVLLVTDNIATIYKHKSIYENLAKDKDENITYIGIEE